MELKWLLPIQSHMRCFLNRCYSTKSCMDIVFFPTPALHLNKTGNRNHSCSRDEIQLPASHRTDLQIPISQLKFLYPLKTLAFPAFSPLRFGPFPSFFPLREEMRETFFRPSLQPYPVALRKFAWPLWWRGRKCSSWYLHQNVPAAPAHPWVLPREREGWSYMYASTDGSENHPYPRSSFGSIGIRC